MLWIKQVEMVDSLDDVQSSHSFQGCTNFPNLETQDVRIVSALNQIIQNSYFVWRNRMLIKSIKRIGSFAEDRSPTYLHYFRVTGAHDTVLDYADFSLSLFATMIVKNLIRDGMKIYLWPGPPRMTSWKVCTN